MRALILSAALVFPLVTAVGNLACSPGGGGDDGDTEVDDPDTGEGEGDGEGDGEGEGDAGGEGEGEGEGDGGGGCVTDDDCADEPQCTNGCTCDVGSGFCVPPGEEYTGAPEDGVKCDASVCTDTTDACCVTFGGSSCVADGTCNAGFNFPCDGPEDCAADTEECCVQSSPGYHSVCVAAGTCEQDVDPADGQADGATVCVTTADCLDTELCCGLAPGGFELPVDMGICAPAENNCQAG